MLIKEIMCQKRNENLVQENDMYNKIYGYYLVFIIYSSKIFYERNKFYNYTTQQNRANFDMILIITRLREKLFLRTTSDLSLLPTRENRNSLKSHLLLFFIGEKHIDNSELFRWNCKYITYMRKNRKRMRQQQICFLWLSLWILIETKDYLLY